MAAITFRQLPDLDKQRLRLRAAANGRSMEGAREILVTALAAPSRVDANWIQQLVDVADDIGGVELEIADDQPAESADTTSPMIILDTNVISDVMRGPTSIAVVRTWMSSLR